MDGQIIWKRIKVTIQHEQNQGKTKQKARIKTHYHSNLYISK